MEDSQKMTALKKAYAEIILNTSKEAAVKIMVSERKARRFQHDLSAAKEEALRLLLRVKQTMDDKLKEAEMKSLCQQNRIDELEAQLHEAEDIVGNLRSDLNAVHMRLDETTKTQKHSAPEMTAKVVCKPEVPSIIMRSKKTELYRNGCTQRIRACEGTLLNGHFPFSGKITREDIGERAYMIPPLASEITLHAQDNPVEIKEVIKDGKASYKVSSLIHRKRNRGASLPSIVPEINAPNEHEANVEGEDVDKEVANSLVLIREQDMSRECLYAPSSTPQVESEDVQSIDLDLEKVDGIPSSPPAKERVLKYTFQRKRMKETLKQNRGVNPPKYSATVVDSSRDSRRMAQVARQLISLSEKKWWK